MLKVDPNLNHVPVNRDQVMTLLEAVNAPMVNIPNVGTAPTRAYVLGTRTERGGLTMYVVLRQPDSGNALVYVSEPRELSPAQFRVEESEAVRFVEGMGFSMENTNFRTLTPDKQEAVMQRIPIFRSARGGGGAEMQVLDLLDVAEDASPLGEMIDEGDSGAYGRADAMFGGISNLAPEMLRRAQQASRPIGAPGVALGPPGALGPPQGFGGYGRPGQMLQGQMLQGQMLQGQMHQGQMHQGQMHQGQMLQGQMHQGQMLQGQALGQGLPGQPLGGQPLQGHPFPGQPMPGQAMPTPSGVPIVQGAAVQNEIEFEPGLSIMGTLGGMAPPPALSGSNSGLPGSPPILQGAPMGTLNSGMSPPPPAMRGGQQSAHGTLSGLPGGPPTLGSMGGPGTLSGLAGGPPTLGSMGGPGTLSGLPGGPPALGALGSVAPGAMPGSPPPLARGPAGPPPGLDLRASSRLDLPAIGGAAVLTSSPPAPLPAPPSEPRAPVLEPEALARLGRFLSTFAVLAALAIPTGCQTQQRGADGLSPLVQTQIDLGDQQLSQGLFPDAIRTFTEVIQESNNVKEAHNGLGLAYMNLGRFEDAERHLRKAIELDPKWSIPKNTLAAVLIRSQRCDEAVKLLTDVMEDIFYTTPEYAEHNLARAESCAGRRKDAVRRLEGLLVRRPQFCLGYLTLADMSADEKLPEVTIKACEDFEVQCENHVEIRKLVSPENSCTCYIKKGLAYAELGDVQAARQSFSRCKSTGALGRESQSYLQMLPPE